MSSRALKQSLVAMMLGGVFFLTATTMSHAGPVVPIGSDFLETVPGTTFMGIPFTGVPLPGHGKADTEIRRLQEANAPQETIPIEMVGLQLMSVGPVDLGAGLGFHFITLQSARGGPASTGQMTIDFAPETFSSFFDVFFDVRLDALNGPIILSDDLVLSSARVPWCQPGFIPGCGGIFEEQHPTGAIHRVRTPTPAPTALILLGSGLVVFAAAAWRRYHL